jgi:hypothetical protein
VTAIPFRCIRARGFAVGFLLAERLSVFSRIGLEVTFALYGLALGFAP